MRQGAGEARKVAAMRCLLVEDDIRSVEIQCKLLRNHGYEVVAATTISEALAEIRARTPDLVLLDLRLPDSRGTETVRKIRKHFARPLIVVTGLGDPESRVRALELGADDILVKPFFARELIARIHAVTRRMESATQSDDNAHPPAAPPPGSDSRLTVDHQRRLVHYRGKAVELTRIEFEVLALLARTPGAVVRRELILDEVWGTAYTASHSLESHITSIRRKTFDRSLIRAHRGVGYSLSSERRWRMQFGRRGMGRRGRSKTPSAPALAGMAEAGALGLGQ